MDEEYGVPREEDSWREYPDGDVPIEEFTLDEMAEDEPPEGLYPSEEDGAVPEEEPPAPAPEPYAGEYEEYEENEEPEEVREGPVRRPNLLNKKGKLRRPRWATTDIYEYNKEYLRHPSRRKEWEFYQLSNTRYVFQVTYGTAAYAGLAGVTLVDFTTGERFSSGKKQLFPGDRLDLDFSGGQPHSLKYEDDDLFLSISFDGQVRRILVRSDRFDADISCHDAGDAIVTAMPFSLPGQFYYNYKKIFRDLAGHLYLHNVNRHLDGETFLLLDSGRGILPYRHSWIWASGARETDRGVLALNLGSGLGKEGSPTENAIFLDGKIQKLGRVFFKFSPEDCMKPWRISDTDRRLHLVFRPSFDNHTDTNWFLVHNRCHQVFGRLSGTVELDSGEVLRLNDMPFFCEHAVNRW